MRFELFVARRYLWGKRRVSFISTILWVSVAGVFLGTLVLVVTLAIMNGFEREVKQRIVGAFAHAKIQKFHQDPIESPDSLMAVIEEDSRVLATAPLIEDKVGLSAGEAKDGILLRGVDLAREIKVTDLKKNLKSGALEFGPVVSSKNRENPGIVLGAYVADRLRVAAGDEVVLLSLKAEEDALMGLMPKMKRATVSGIYESGMYEYDANLAFVSIETAQDLLGLKGVNAIEVRVHDPGSAPAVARDLEQRLGYPYTGIDWMRQYRTLIKWMNTEKLIAFIVISMIILVAVFNIMSSLLMVIMEKTGEIGILLSMGAHRASILKIFVFNGLLVGLLGAFSGSAAGLAICFLQIKFHFVKLPGDVYFIDALPVIVRWPDVAWVVAAALFLCFVFSLYPARKAARMKPVEALVYK